MKKPLRIWLVQTGEEMPDDPGPPRLLRTALLARELVSRGNEVTYWNATFNHQQKVQRFAQSSAQRSSHGYDVQFLAGRAYQRNISANRIFSHMENAREFKRIAPTLPQPDVILSGLPTLELCAAVADFAVPRSIPFAIDCRDMWPDIFSDHLTGIKSIAGWPLMEWWRYLQRKSLSRATAITGVTSGFVNWGVRAARRPIKPLDRAFHLAVPAANPSPAEMEASRKEWQKLVDWSDPETVVACYPGTLSKRLDIPALMEGLARVSPEVRKRFRMVICGKGDMDDLVRNSAADLPHVVFAGWKGAADLRVLMERSDFGVLPYRRTEDFQNHFVNKVGEYLAAGLPIMTGLGGLTGDLLSRTGTGLFYDVGNADSVARTIEDAVARRDELAANKDAARAIYRQMFDPAVIYTEFADYLEQLASTDIAGPGRV